LLHVDHGSSLGEKVLWIVLIWVESNSFVGEESSCEIISAYDSENSLINIEILSNVQITPGIVF